MSSPPPAPRRRRDGWTPEREAAFIAALTGGASIAAAAAAAGLSRQSAYVLRRRSAAAAAAWGNAAPLSEDEAFAAVEAGVADFLAPLAVGGDRWLIRMFAAADRRAADVARKSAKKQWKL